jgi:phosphoenolpyruvate synthase/pyruvate phosphate dikinase
MSESEGIQAEETYVVSFDNTRVTDRALVGSKGANLARLAAAGLPVPEGVCVTSLAYDALVDDPSIQNEIIQQHDIPEKIYDAIETAIDAIASGPEQAYTVRSSATAKYLPEASFAGQQESFLNVYGADDITDRVRAYILSIEPIFHHIRLVPRHLWRNGERTYDRNYIASLFTNRAIADRAKNNIPREEMDND